MSSNVTLTPMGQNLRKGLASSSPSAYSSHVWLYLAFVIDLVVIEIALLFRTVQVSPSHINKKYQLQTAILKLSTDSESPSCIVQDLVKRRDIQQRISPTKNSLIHASGYVSKRASKTSEGYLYLSKWLL